mmetsp:Transcript_30170/g.48425  ORF Transcript_30170/g.48425 Transcript_30170/m.48425 type:complete len:209 (-) Transcript_30170:71-697(-)
MRYFSISWLVSLSSCFTANSRTSGFKKSSESSSRASSLVTVFSFSHSGSIFSASSLSSGSLNSTHRRNLVIVFFMVVSRYRNFHRSSRSCAFISFMCNGVPMMRRSAARSRPLGFTWSHALWPKFFASFWNLSSTGLGLPIPGSCSTSSRSVWSIGRIIFRCCCSCLWSNFEDWLSAVEPCHATTGYRNFGRVTVNTSGWRIFPFARP